MSGITGFYHPIKNYMDQQDSRRAILERMNQALSKRGPDGGGSVLSSHAGLGQVRLAVSDLKGDAAPLTKSAGDGYFAIAFDGNLYNAGELKNLLSSRSWTFETESDAEIVLAGFMEYGPDFVKKMNGAFAFAVFDPIRQSLYLFRDRLGIKPLFFTVRDNEIIFASELKGIFAFPAITPAIGKKGLSEIFCLGPAKTPGCGVFESMEEVLPGRYLACEPDKIRQIPYWNLISRPHEDSYEATVEKTAELLKDSVLRQMNCDVPLCSFLSGGVDSSLVSAICAAELKKKGERLTTFSFDFAGNDLNFKSNDFQPSLDRPFVDQMAAFLGTDHHYLECDAQTQADLLYDSVCMRDLPAMADVDSSLLHFCSLVSGSCKVALTGECADEIFGGYPWFHRKEMFEAQTFPWTMDLTARKALFKDDFLEYLDMDSYIRDAYEKSVAETPALSADTPSAARFREISFLNLRWFMQTLLDRMDRTSAASGIDARVPFADHRIVEYLWNVPFEMKAKDGIVKRLLREAGNGLIPDEILYRRKSPYPKTYDTRYEQLLVKKIRAIMADNHAPVRRYLDEKKVFKFLESPADYGKPWYGQLMAGPQLLAYVIQVNHWLEIYLQTSGCDD